MTRLRWLAFGCGLACALGVIHFTWMDPYDETPVAFEDLSWNSSLFSNAKDPAAVKAYFHAHQMSRQVVSNDLSGKVFFQRNWEPSYSCTVTARLGAPGDGGKWICDPHRALTQECVVYSIGSNDDFSFEEAVHRFNPKCEIHTFDPTPPKNNRPPFVSFHPWTLLGHSGEDDNNEAAPFTYTIPAIMRRLGHDRVSVLKVDCEGCELDAFSAPAFRVREGAVQQIQVEIHFDRNPERIHAMLRFLSSRGYAIFSKEPNIQYSNGKAVEFALVHLDWVK